MSEYQYYEFRAIDRPLTEEEQQALGKLSSRVDLSPSHAIFVYNYSDLPARAEDLLAQGREAQLSIAFNRELLKLLDRSQPEQPARRTIGDLMIAADRIEKEVQTKGAAKARANHLKRMESLAAREGQLWQEVIDLIKQKRGNAYDQAVAHLKDLRFLAQHQGEEAAFQARLNTIYRDYRSLSALLRRLRSAKLYEL